METFRLQLDSCSVGLVRAVGPGPLLCTLLWTAALRRPCPLAFCTCAVVAGTSREQRVRGPVQGSRQETPMCRSDVACG